MYIARILLNEILN